MKAERFRYILSGARKGYEVSSEREILIIFIFIWSSIEGIIDYYVRSGAVPHIYYYVNDIILLMFFLYGFWGKNKAGKIAVSNKYEQIYIIFFIANLGYSIIMGGIEGELYRTLACTIIYLQIIDAFFYNDITCDLLNKIFCILAVISIVLFFSVYLKLNINISYAIGRGYQWKEIFYYTAPFWAAPAFVILAFIQKKHVPLSIAYFAVSVLLNMIIVKRMILIETAILSVICFFIIASSKNKIENFLKAFLFVCIAFFVVYVYAGEVFSILFKSVFTRIIQTAGDISTFDRFVESGNYLKSAGIIKILFGGGFGGTHDGLGHLSESLHVGWVNLILKGGIFLLFMTLLPYLNIFHLLGKFKKLSDKTKFSVCYLCFMFPMLFFRNMHGFSPNMLLFYMCILQVAGRKSLEV